MVRPHVAWIILRIDAFAHEQSRSYLAAQSFVFPNRFGQTLGLVTGKRIHRIHDNDLYARLVLEPIAVIAIVKYGVEKTLCLARTGSRGQQGGFRLMTILHAQLPERLQLMLVGSEVGSYLQWNVGTFFCRRRDKRSLQRYVWTLEKAILLVLYEAVEGIADVLFLETECGFDVLNDRVAHFAGLL